MCFFKQSVLFSWLLVVVSCASTNDCPPPYDFPRLQFDVCANPRLQVQRNFHRISIWAVSAESGLQSVVTTENLNRLPKELLPGSLNVEVELDRSITPRDGWFVACSRYDYVITQRRSCSFCSFFKLCRVEPQLPPDCHEETSEGQADVERITTRTCDDQIVSLLPDLQLDSNWAALSFFISSYSDELPVAEALLSMKVVRVSLCVPDKVVVTEKEYVIYPNTFLVVNISSLEAGKIYQVHFQATVNLKIGPSPTKIHFRPEKSRFRLPTATTFCRDGLPSDRN